MSEHHFSHNDRQESLRELRRAARILRHLGHSRGPEAPGVAQEWLTNKGVAVIEHERY